MLALKFFLVILISIISISKVQGQDTKTALINFDEAIHYNYSLKRELPSWDSKSTLIKCSKKEELRKLLYKNTPTQISDSNAFIRSLTENDFYKQIIQQDKLDSIRIAFSIKDTTIISMSRCTAIYRDILVFKYQNRIIAIAKLCLNCRIYHFIGVDENKIQLFGQNGEWEILKKVLNYEGEPSLWELYQNK